MRIGLNGTAFDELSSGARDRFLRLYGEASRRTTDHDFVMYSPRDVDLAPLFPGRLEGSARTPLSPRSTIRRFLSSRRWFARRLRTDGIDVFVTDHFPVVTGPRVRTLLTIHDLRCLVLPGEGSWLRRTYFRRRFPKDAAAARAVVTVSETIRSEVTENLGLPADRVHVVPNGVAPDFRAPARARDYLLALGVFERRKNLSLLLRVLASDRAGTLPPLVLSGRGGPEEDALRAEVERLGIADRVRFAGYTPEADLPALVAGAAALVVPSLYEGFGLPLLQAFAVDTPVVCSTAPALVEVAGDAAVTVDPGDETAWAEALGRVLEEGALRERLTAAGRERAAGYSWTAAADRFLEVVEGICSP